MLITNDLLAPTACVLMSAVSPRRSFDVALKFATHDAAFDKHLTSVDEDHGIIASPVLRDPYKGEPANEFFCQKTEGRAVSLLSICLTKPSFKNPEKFKRF